MTSPVKPFPAPFHPPFRAITSIEIADHYIDLASAWESRCRVAVEALSRVEFKDTTADEARFLAMRALGEIGELPVEGEKV